MTYRVGPKGQVVVPKRIRDSLGIRAGDEVTVEQDGEDVRIRRVRDVERLRGALARSGADLLAELEAEHRLEIERDERRVRGLR